MIVKEFLEHQEIRKDIEPLFISAFPSDERPSEDIYFENFKKNKNAILYGFYDDSEFVGFSSVILYKDICYIFFLAVSSNKRDQGYGSQILSEIKHIYNDNVILLCYEEVDNKYQDFEMRLRRKNFYMKNGFIDNPLKTNEFGVVFQTAYYGKHTVSFKDYKEIFAIGFGPYVVKYLKEHK